ncbi:MAG: ATP-dependent DNA helicase [Planctomycetes bacterium]|nr:ATP-dependent DNA helicase [Planctomycetota bacterium]
MSENRDVSEKIDAPWPCSPGKMTPVSLAADLPSLFGPDGPLARRLEGYERRPEQEALCTAIAETLDKGGTIVAEAGTGVGKSFAYLVPAILLAERTKKRVVVSTRTKALQAQLATKDIPFLQAVLPIEFTATVCVGRNNYVCRRRLETAWNDRNSLFDDGSEAEELASILDWVRRGPEFGLRSELSFVPSAKAWGEVQAESGNCLGAACRHYEPCEWQKAKRRMQTSQILIVNHALYFADLQLRRQGAQYLPDHHLVVFDEAHHVENIASEALGARLTPGMLEWVLSRLAGRRNKGLLARHGLYREIEAIEAIRRVAKEYWARIDTRMEPIGSGTLRMGTEDVVEDTLSSMLDGLARGLHEFAESAERETELEIKSRADRLFDLATIVRSFAAPAADGTVRWIERERAHCTLHAAPVRIGDILREALFDQVPNSVLVSATLGPPDDGFAWLRERLGIDRMATTLRVGSPFPYRDNVRFEVEEGLPDPSSQALEFEREAAHRVVDLCLDNDGSALVLCTSWRFAQRCAEVLRPALAAIDVEVLVQGERPLEQLVEQKRADKRSVLVGTDSLWEGIDLPGDAVTLVILTRFPFPVPSHPLTAARADDLEKRGASSFHEYMIPLALLKFVQGFGRLVRSSHDKGRVVLLDPRARRKRYGRRFLDALPGGLGEAAD